MKSNLNNLAENTDFETLDKKETPSFTIDKIIKSSIFNINKLKNYTSDNYTFDISIDGKLTNELEPKTFNIGIPVTHMSDKADCVFNIKQNQTADLNCKLNIEQYKQYSQFSFKVIDIDDDGSPIYLSRINEIYLLNKAKEEENTKEKDNNNKNIILIVIIPVVFVIIIVAGVITYVKFKSVEKTMEKKALQEKANYDGYSVTTHRGFKSSKSIN